MSRTLRFGLLLGFVLFGGSVSLTGCASAPQLPYHGFQSQAALDQNDAMVARESVGGGLDPNNLAQADQRYAHDNTAYNQVEEGYYRWGQKMYSLGYRDVYYVRDMAPHAFRHELLDTYDHAIEKGFEDAEKEANHK